MMLFDCVCSFEISFLSFPTEFPYASRSIKFVLVVYPLEAVIFSFSSFYSYLFINFASSELSKNVLKTP